MHRMQLASYGGLPTSSAPSAAPAPCSGWHAGAHGHASSLITAQHSCGLPFHTPKSAGVLLLPREMLQAAVPTLAHEPNQQRHHSLAQLWPAVPDYPVQLRCSCSPERCRTLKAQYLMHVRTVLHLRVCISALPADQRAPPGWTNRKPGRFFAQHSASPQPELGSTCTLPGAAQLGPSTHSLVCLGGGLTGAACAKGPVIGLTM